MPVVVTPPGVLVNVQMLDGGRPFSTTLPAATLHVGWVIVPAVGAVGVAGWALITTLPDDDETHPDVLITV